jgi:poly(A) polymerase
VDKTAVLGEELTPVVIPRADHNISRKSISRAALKVLYRLKDAGYQSHLVGGGVRDLLLGKTPKDFDVATDAHPEQVKALFSNCRLIGRRFRLAHVHFGREIIEVATFRANHQSGADGLIGGDGRIVRDNVFGNIEQDANRRDFTVNALYYNIADFSIIDYTNGLADLKSGTLRMIGDPATRYREDAVRMLRAARFSAKLGFTLHPDTQAPIAELSPMLRDIPAARLFEEVLKLLQNGHAHASFAALRELDLLCFLFPITDQQLKSGDAFFARMIERALRNTDARIEEGKPVTPAYLYAVFLWPLVEETALKFQRQGESPVSSYFAAADEVLPQQLRATSLPKRFSIPMREIWALQPRLLNTSGKHVLRLLGHPRFRAAYNLLCLREYAGEDLQDRGSYWTQLQENTPQDAVESERTTHADKRRRSRNRRRKQSGNAG